jgi:protein SCO1/2
MKFIKLNYFIAGILIGIVILVILGLDESSTLPVLGEVPDFNLVTHTGDRIRLIDLKDDVWVANFFFTSCAGICPKITEQMARVQEKFKNNSDLKLVSFTVDPVRDSIDILASYAKMWKAIDGKWFFVTGDRKKIYELIRYGFKLPVVERDEGGALGNFIHSGKFVLVDRNGNIRGYYEGTRPEEVDKLMEDINLILKEGS